MEISSVNQLNTLPGLERTEPPDATIENTSSGPLSACIDSFQLFVAKNSSSADQKKLYQHVIDLLESLSKLIAALASLAGDLLKSNEAASQQDEVSSNDAPPAAPADQSENDINDNGDLPVDDSSPVSPDEPASADDTDAAAGEAAGDQAIGWYSKAVFTKTVERLLSGEDDRDVNEEEFQHAIVYYLLRTEDHGTAEYYLRSFNAQMKKKGAAACAEDAVKAALAATVKHNLISQEKAEEINGLSFFAAQLDDKPDLLFDGKGGENDNTIAVKTRAEAIALADDVLKRAAASELEIVSRPLDALSNSPGEY